MKFHSPMIVVSDINESKKFYTEVLHEEIQQDLGTYVIFGGGFSMMTREQWSKLTNDATVSEKSVGHSFELYYEEDQIDEFVQELEKHSGIRKFTGLEEASWGQRTVRFLDPDGHVVEVSESMEAVVKRLLLSGMTVQEVSEKSMMPVTFVEKYRADIAETS